MSLIAQLVRPAAGKTAQSESAPEALGTGTGSQGPDALHSGLPVVWHIVVDIPYADTSRRTGLSPAGAIARLEQQSARVRNARRILALLGEYGSEDDWLVTVSPKGVRAERDGGSFEQLEQRLHDEGFGADDVTIGVEYARSWGML